MTDFSFLDFNPIDNEEKDSLSRLLMEIKYYEIIPCKLYNKEGVNICRNRYKNQWIWIENDYMCDLNRWR